MKQEVCKILDLAGKVETLTADLPIPFPELARWAWPYMEGLVPLLVESAAITLIIHLPESRSKATLSHPPMKILKEQLNHRRIEAENT
jgi:hypothetical protein